MSVSDPATTPNSQVREIARATLLQYAEQLRGYTLNFESGMTIFDQIIRLMGRDSEWFTPTVENARVHLETLDGNWKTADEIRAEAQRANETLGGPDE